jgi:hypothetical protein
MAITAGAAELTLLLVFDVFVLLARAGGTMSVRAGVAITAFAHLFLPAVIETSEDQSHCLRYPRLWK